MRFAANADRMGSALPAAPTVGATGAFLTCFGFLVSRLLRFWLFAMVSPFHLDFADRALDRLAPLVAARWSGEGRRDQLLRRAS
jgi:hypothetical protein